VYTAGCGGACYVGFAVIKFLKTSNSLILENYKEIARDDDPLSELYNTFIVGLRFVFAGLVVFFFFLNFKIY